MKNSRFFLYLFLVLAMVCLVDILVSFSLELMFKGRYDSRIQNAVERKAEIGIIGASRASHHYDSQLLEDSLNKTVFNYGIDGRNIYVHYAILKKLIDNKEAIPNTILLDLSSVDIYDMHGYNKERLNILYPYYKDSTINGILNDLLDKPNLTSIKYSGLVRHNSNLLQYAKEWIKPVATTNKGFIPLQNKCDKNLDSAMNETHKIDPEKIRYLKKFIEECKDNHITLFLVSSPSLRVEKDKQWMNEIQNIAEEEGVSYLNYYNDPLFVNHKELFSDPDHLNQTGAIEFSNRLLQSVRPSLTPS